VHGHRRSERQGGALGNPRTTLAGGIGFVPDDRKRQALLPTRSVGENFSIAWNGMLSRYGLMNMREERQMVRDSIKRYGVVTTSAASRITTLSGGNQQKVVLGRMFALGSTCSCSASRPGASTSAPRVRSIA
jgi:ABC-type sugar transport system ATPase subunit